VSGRPSPVEQPGFGEGERARTDRRDASARGIRGFDGVQHLVGGSHGDVVAAWDDDRVGLGHRLDPVIGADAHRPRGDDGLRAADQHPVPRRTRRQRHAGEDFDGSAQVERDGIR
jgi:hypothetical protein